MVTLANHENVLLLEKDWALIQNSSETASQLSTAVSLLHSAKVHVVRFRHRHLPGAPLHARIMYENRESKMLQQQTNLYCYMHHWIPHPHIKYPQYFSLCPTQTNTAAAVVCATAKYCQWTNNPALFKRAWFLHQLAHNFERDYNNTKIKHPTSNMLDFEFYTNWNFSVWNHRPFVVALPVGLFEHQEIGEQNLMNTVWYAWNRLSTDVQETRMRMLANHTDGCYQQHFTNHTYLSFENRFPIQFVRLYHFQDANRRTASQAIAELREEAERMRRVVDRGGGTWRNGVTELTNLWYKLALFQLPTEPQNMVLAFVTALFRMGDVHAQFERRIGAVVRNLHALREYQLVVYAETGAWERVRGGLRTIGWTDERIGKVIVREVELRKFAEQVLTRDTVERMEELYESKEWRDRMKKRMIGENEILTFENVLFGHLKVYFVADADVEDVTHVVWFDAGTSCIESELSSRNDVELRADLMLHGFVTGVQTKGDGEMEIALEGSGIDMDLFKAQMEGGGSLVDLKTFGGSRVMVVLMRAYFDVVMRDFLKRGQLGSGREAISVAVKNVDYNFRFFQAGSVVNGYMRENSQSACNLFQRLGRCSSVKT